MVPLHSNRTVTKTIRVGNSAVLGSQGEPTEVLLTSKWNTHTEEALALKGKETPKLLEPGQISQAVSEQARQGEAGTVWSDEVPTVLRHRNRKQDGGYLTRLQQFWRVGKFWRSYEQCCTYTQRDRTLRITDGQGSQTWCFHLWPPHAWKVEPGGWRAWATKWLHSEFQATLGWDLKPNIPRPLEKENTSDYGVLCYILLDTILK